MPVAGPVVAERSLAGGVVDVARLERHALGPGRPPASSSVCSALRARRRRPCARSPRRRRRAPPRRARRRRARRPSRGRSRPGAPARRRHSARAAPALTSKYGFSVVAPISVTRPLSTPGSRASCWRLLKRWISSRKRIVRFPLAPRRSRARGSTPRTSSTRAETADSSSNAPPTLRRRSGRASSFRRPAGRRGSSTACAPPRSRGAAPTLGEHVPLPDELVERRRPDALWQGRRLPPGPPPRR